MTQGEVERLKRLYKEGKSFEKIAEALSYNSGIISNTVNLLVSMGELEKRVTKRGRPRIREEKPKVVKVKVEEPKEYTYGCSCNKYISRKCKYGYDSGENLCNYILIKKKMRPCSWKACTCFEPR